MVETTNRIIVDETPSNHHLLRKAVWKALRSVDALRQQTYTLRVRAEDGVVTLSGLVATEAQKVAAGEAAGSVSGVERVIKAATDPLLVVYDNLILAQNFFRHAQYASARYTLQNVKKGLAQLEKEKIESPEAQSVKTLNNEITQLETELEKKDPTLMQRVTHKFSAWKNTVKP